jgi:FHS family L-fucose permease-like MFS transporter
MVKLFGMNGSQEPTMEQVHEQQGRRPSTVEVVSEQTRRKSIDNRVVTGASQLTARQSVVPVILVTTLFFMWGFAYGLLDVLNSRFQVALHITKGESSGLQASYFGAYFIGPLTYSGWFLRKFGYRYTFILGLSIYCVGALMFWPSAVKRSFGGFCGAMFLAGSGLSTLEVSANPYIAVCGPPKWSEFRLELSQSVQAVGSVVAPVLAAQVIFKNVGADGRSLEAVQWVYLGIAGFVAILAVVFYFAPIPEITDSDMADQAEMTTAATGYVDKPLRKQYTLFWGTFAQFSYVGAQVGVAAYFINYFEQARPDLNVTEAHVKGANFYAIAQGLFAAGRFAAAGLMYFGGKPRIVLMLFQTLIMIFIAAAIGVNTGGTTRPNWGGLSMLMIVLFFESCIVSLPALTQTTQLDSNSQSSSQSSSLSPFAVSVATPSAVPPSSSPPSAVVLSSPSFSATWPTRSAPGTPCAFLSSSSLSPGRTPSTSTSPPRLRSLTRTLSLTSVIQSM